MYYNGYIHYRNCSQGGVKLVELIRPSIEYEAQAKDLYKNWIAFEDSIEACSGLDCFLKDDPINGYKDWLIKTNLNWNGLCSEASYVLQRTYFISNGKELVGFLGITLSLDEVFYNVGGHIGIGISPNNRRKHYAKDALLLALDKCYQWEMDKILVICNETNMPSRLLIESCGGVFENEYSLQNDVYRRYWFKLT